MIQKLAGWSAGRILRGAGIGWYLLAATGQLAFIWFILGHYGASTLAGNYPAWNDRPLIDGYTEGDAAGNLMFVLHVLLAAVITLGGLLQLLPQLRRALPDLHRWNGRLFIVIAVFMAVGGLWLVWVRGTRISLVSALAITTDAILILVFAALTLYYGMQRQFDSHRRWALRAFMVVNGVWFLRVGFMAWTLLANGIGMNERLSGPVDTAILFGSYLIPLGVLQVYFWAQDSASATKKLAAALLIAVATVVMAVGIYGTVTLMWALTS